MRGFPPHCCVINLPCGVRFSSTLLCHAPAMWRKVFPNTVVSGTCPMTCEFPQHCCVRHLPCGVRVSLWFIEDPWVAMSLYFSSRLLSLWHIQLFHSCYILFNLWWIRLLHNMYSMAIYLVYLLITMTAIWENLSSNEGL